MCTAARVPIASHARASLDGLAVIRTLKCQGLLTREFSSFQDSHTESHFLFIASSRWLAFRLDVLCLLFLFMASFGPLFVIERQGECHSRIGSFLVVYLSILRYRAQRNVYLLFKLSLWYC